MKSTLRRITALVLALSLALSLCSLSLAAESETEDASPAAAVQAEEQSGQAEQQEEQPAVPDEEENQEEAPDRAESPQENFSEPSVSPEVEEIEEEQTGDGSANELSTASSLEEQTEGEPVESPAVIEWENGTYTAQLTLAYNGKEQRPKYRLMRDGAEVPTEDGWTESWYTDEACTVPAKDFAEVGTRYLRLMDGDTIKAQGSYAIGKGKQRITVSKASVEQHYQKGGTFSLGAKTSGDGKLSYTSSDSSVLSVDKKGKCTMNKPGIVTITIKAKSTSHYKSASGQVQVSVYRKAKNLGYSKSYRKSKYYKALAKLKLTGSIGENATDIALSQLGYKEGRSSGQLAGNGKGKGNWTEYGRQYGLNHQPWCAIFVNWCAREAGASYSAVPKYAACRYYHSYFKRQGRFHSWKSVRSGSYKPKKGDIILYAYTKGGVAHHIGYVMDVSYEGKKVHVTTVEGNTDDKVRIVDVNYSSTGSGKHGSHYILGMANPKW